MSSINELLAWRYAAKKLDASKAVAEADVDYIFWNQFA